MYCANIMFFYHDFLLHTQLAKLAHTAMALLALLVIFYVLIIKPQQQERKRLLELTSLLKPGIIVSGDDGIVGVVLTIFAHSIIIQLATGKKIELLKQQIRHVHPNT